MMSHSVRFEEAQPPATPHPDGVHSVGAFLQQRTLKRELLAELRNSWEQGNPIPVDDLLSRWPGDPDTDGDVVSLLFENHLQRTRIVPSSPAMDVQATVPRQQSVLDMVRHHELLRSVGMSVNGDSYLRLPEIGEAVFGFQLRRELGRGAFARVFVANQADLAGRPVVLKVSQIQGTEPQTLAQLQHTNIVPIHSVHEDKRAGLRVLCMPYFGGASLSEVLKTAWRHSTPPTTGRELVQALDAAAYAKLEKETPSELSKTERERCHGGQTPRTHLAELPFIQAVAWVAAALADGLAHAHQRGVLHRDIKPSNILLAADGQPMLLDFNLAHDASQESAHAVLGGTIAYMAPEHLRAMTTGNAVLVRRVDQRADIYSLGMVLFEMLCGSSPFEQSGSYTPLPILVEAMAVERETRAPSLRKVRPGTPWTLESIIRRCLDPDLTSRYQHAEQLADDLRCFLEDRPLRHAPELSLLERGRKWTRRHPRLFWAGLVTAVSACLLLAAMLIVAQIHARLVQTSDQLTRSRAKDRKRHFESGTQSALFYVNTKNDLSDHLSLGESAARETLNLFQILERSDWQEQPDWKCLERQERLSLAEGARVLLLLLADARVRLSNWDRGTLREALTLLDRAQSIADLPPCQALWRDRAAYLEHLGDRAGADAARGHAEAIPATTARDRYLLSMTNARERRYSQAILQLNEAVRINPRDYWSWMQRGLCHQEMGDSVTAIGDFGTCVGLYPDFAWGYYNRAVALTAQGRRQEALVDYTQALALDPNLLAARLNCGMLHLELRQYAEALAALQKVERAGRDDAPLHSGLGIALEGLGRHAEADAAFTQAEERAASATPEVRQRVRRAYGFAVAARLPDQARSAFLSVLHEYPTDAESLYGCGMLHDRLGEAAAALHYFNLALETAPGFEEARRFRALVLARSGDFQAARIDINACLGKDSPSGATYYAAACIAALQAEQSLRGTKGSIEQEALQMLHEAFIRDYGVAIAREDSDLKGIRFHPEFERLVAEAARNSPGK
jgi:eukaryotic-like serine/threonine-protein kinase